MEDKERAEKLAAMRKKAQALKAKKEKREKKAKEESEAVAETPEPEKPVEETKPEEDPTTNEDKPDEVEGDSGSPESGTLSPAEKSKMRSLSFRTGSADATADEEADGVREIYKKQLARIEELEGALKEAVKERDEERRVRGKVESELEVLREGEGSDELKEENEALKREVQTLKATARRHNNASVSLSAGVGVELLQEELKAKTATLEGLESELSTLQAKLTGLEESTVSKEVHEVSIAELAVKTSEIERLQASLATAEKNLTEALATSTDADTAETLSTLQSEISTLRTTNSTLESTTADLTRKLTTQTALVKSLESRIQSLSDEKDTLQSEKESLQARLDNPILSSSQIPLSTSSNDSIDDLLARDRAAFQERIQALEAENSELKRGIWKERKKSIVEGGASWSEVDLGSAGGRGHARKITGTGLGDLLASGFSAIAGGADDDDSLLSDDGDMAFDEEEFRRAREEEAKARLERVRDLKRGLKNWEGWRLDLVDIRKGVVGLGDVFDV